MPMLIAALQNGLPGAGGADYPATRTACANAWGDAVQSWMVGVIPASTTVAAATVTLKTALDAAFAAPAAAALMETAFAAFAGTVAAGMLAGGWAAAPPVAPVNIAAVFALPAPTTRQEGVNRVATALDTWARTALATPTLGGPAVNWS